MKNFEENRINIISLMGRMENRKTLTEAVEYENELLLENSRRVSDQTFMQFLTHYQIHKNRFISLAYINLYPTGSVYPTDDNYNTMDSAKNDPEFGPNNQRGSIRFNNFIDKVKNTEWGAPTGRAFKGQKAMGQKLYPYVIKLTKYRMTWQAYDKYKENASKAYKGISDLENQLDDNTKSLLSIRHNNIVDKDGNKISYGYYPMGDEGNFDILTYGSKDEMGNYTPIEQQYLTDPDDLTSTQSFQKKAFRNYLSNAKAQVPVYFGVDEDGNVDPIPNSVGKILYNKATNKDSSTIIDQQQKTLADQYLNAVKDDAMRNKTFMMDNVAYICCTVTDSGNKESVYWVNPKPLFLLEKSKTVNKEKTTYKYAFQNLNENELENILKSLAQNDADEILALSNDNAKGNAMYGDDSI